MEIPVDDAHSRPDGPHVTYSGSGNVARWQHCRQCRWRRDAALLEVLRSGQDTQDGCRQKQDEGWFEPATRHADSTEVEAAILISRSEIVILLTEVYIQSLSMTRVCFYSGLIHELMCVDGH